MMKSPTDHELLSRFRKGDREAFEVFYDRHEAGLYLYISSLTLNAEDTEEAMQNLITAICRNPDNFSAAKEIRSYLYRSARNCVIGLRRKSLHEQEKKELATRREKEKGQNAPTLIEAEHEEESARMNQLLRQLPGEEREAVILHIYENFSFREMGELTEVSEKTLFSRYQRALKKLKQEMEKHHG